MLQAQQEVCLEKSGEPVVKKEPEVAKPDPPAPQPCEPDLAPLADVKPADLSNQAGAQAAVAGTAALEACPMAGPEPNTSDASPPAVSAATALVRPIQLVLKANSRLEQDELQKTKARIIYQIVDSVHQMRQVDRRAGDILFSRLGVGSERHPAEREARRHPEDPDTTTPSTAEAVGAGSLYKVDPRLTLAVPPGIKVSPTVRIDRLVRIRDRAATQKRKLEEVIRDADTLIEEAWREMLRPSNPEAGNSQRQ